MEGDTSMRSFFSRESTDTLKRVEKGLWTEYDFKNVVNGNLSNEERLLVEVVIIYEEVISSELNSKQKEYTPDDLTNFKKEHKYFSTLTHSARVYLNKEKIKGTFIEEEMSNNYPMYKKDQDKTGKSFQHVDNYMKIELNAKKNKIMLENILECFEYIMNKNFEFNYNKDNLISYFYAFSLCKLPEKRKEVLQHLLVDLSDENIVHFLKVVSTLNDEFLDSYSFWLVRYLVNKLFKLENIIFSGYNFSNVVKFNSRVDYAFDSQRIILTSDDNIISANLDFLNKFYLEKFRPQLDKLFKINNHFNMGRVIRRRSDNLINDYPHYFQLVLENEPSLTLYGYRQSENSNFIISKSIVGIFIIIGRF